MKGIVDERLEVMQVQAGKLEGRGRIWRWGDRTGKSLLLDFVWAGCGRAMFFTKLEKRRR